MKLGFRRAQSVGRDCARGNGRCFPCFNFMPIVPCAYINNTKNKKKIICDVCTSVKRIVADRLFTAKPSERKSSRRDKTRVSHYYVVILFFFIIYYFPSDSRTSRCFCAVSDNANNDDLDPEQPENPHYEPVTRPTMENTSSAPIICVIIVERHVKHTTKIIRIALSYRVPLTRNRKNRWFFSLLLFLFGMRMSFVIRLKLRTVLIIVI